MYYWSIIISKSEFCGTGFFPCYFAVINGVEQGGTISPVLFCVYFDALIVALKESGVGFYMGDFFLQVHKDTPMILFSYGAFR